MPMPIYNLHSKYFGKLLNRMYGLSVLKIQYPEISSLWLLSHTVAILPAFEVKTRLILA
jgi:hypothetical protein